jgi:microcystin-dependent protein
MSEPFLGEIRCVGFNFAPRGWEKCDGQIIHIQSNTALFALLGTTYGGDGQTTFALPNLNKNIPIGGTNYGSPAVHTIPSTMVRATTIRIVLDNP